MENIVNEIIRIDKDADERLINADNEKKKILVSSEKEAYDMKENISARAEKRIKKVIDFHNTETESAVKKIADECEAKIDRLTEIYNTTHTSIEDSIFNSIVNVSIAGAARD